MKKLFLLILILPFVSWAQVDFLNLKKDSVLFNLNGKLNLIPNYSQPQNPDSQRFFRPGVPSLDLRNGQPLFVIDGIVKEEIYSLEEIIDQSQIIKVTELKGASATALYGSRGRNGVMLIKTKKYQEELDSKKTTYDLAVLDLGYESFLAMQPSAGTFTLSYLQNRNHRYVSLWNQRVFTGDPKIYEMPIDYDSKTFYGLEFEYKLYMFFKFMEKKHSVSML